MGSTEGSQRLILTVWQHKTQQHRKKAMSEINWIYQLFQHWTPAGKQTETWLNLICSRFGTWGHFGVRQERVFVSFLFSWQEGQACHSVCADKRHQYEESYPVPTKLKSSAVWKQSAPGSCNVSTLDDGKRNKWICVVFSFKMKSIAFIFRVTALLLQC